jgi:acyl-coenzyme A synthetase/AMP-(fatty) acid ligase
MEARLDRVRRNPRFNTSICFMSLVNVMAVEFFFSVGAWSVGGSVEFFSQPLQQALDKGELKANMLFMNTNQLRELVSTLPAESRPNRSLVVLVGGSVVPKEVYSKALQLFAGSVMIIYGSTEAGIVATNPNPLEYSEPGVCGFVVPGMEAQVINDFGHPVGAGSVGEIRLRSTSCVSSYEDVQAAADSAFRDGWFYPGDLGRLSENGLLTVMGRVDEVINVGGWKVAPALLEEVLVGCSGLRDIAVCAVVDTSGLDQVWVGVVKGEGFSQDALSALWQRCGVPAGQALRIIYVDAIPRNAMGKALRAELSDLVKKHRGQLIATPPILGSSELRDGGATLRVSGTDIPAHKLSASASACVASLQFVDAEMHRMTRQMAVYEKAKAAYNASLHQMLLEGSILRA